MTDAKKAREVGEVADRGIKVGHSLAEAMLTQIDKLSKSSDIPDSFILSGFADALSLALVMRVRLNEAHYPHPPHCKCAWGLFAQAGATLLLPVIGRTALEAALNSSPMSTPEKNREALDWIEKTITEEVSAVVAMQAEAEAAALTRRS